MGASDSQPASSGPPPPSCVSEKVSRLSDKVGRVAISGRYHRLPKRFEDDYELTKKILGTGFNGNVELAHLKSSPSNRFAVKQFKLYPWQPVKKDIMENEVEIYLSMDHPHVARLCDVYENETHLTFVMECMEGGELFERFAELQRFTERDAADAVWQMLLALNHVHSKGIVHRDLKMNNFLYERKESDTLKLIDFGFSKTYEPDTKMMKSVGTLSYIAPEVLDNHYYGNQSDLWSLGVIAFVLLAGEMPFHGAELRVQLDIKAGNYEMKPEKWDSISEEGQKFVKALLTIDPDERMSTTEALDHPWLTKKDRLSQNVALNKDMCDALQKFGKASKFRRTCFQVMAWSLSSEDQAEVREYFMALDKDQTGTITLAQLKDALSGRFNIEDDEVQRIFTSLDASQDQEIAYTEFLSAMVSTRIALHEDLLRQAFNKFDKDNTGFITAQNLRQVLGENFEGDQHDQLMEAAEEEFSPLSPSCKQRNGQVAFADFVAYLREDDAGAHAQAAGIIIDREITRSESSFQAPLSPKRNRKGDDGFGKGSMVTQAPQEPKEEQVKKCCAIC